MPNSIIEKFSVGSNVMTSFESEADPVFVSPVRCFSGQECQPGKIWATYDDNGDFGVARFERKTIKAIDKQNIPALVGDSTLVQEPVSEHVWLTDFFSAFRISPRTFPSLPEYSVSILVGVDQYEIFKLKSGLDGNLYALGINTGLALARMFKIVATPGSESLTFGPSKALHASVTSPVDFDFDELNFCFWSLGVSSPLTDITKWDLVTLAPTDFALSVALPLRSDRVSWRRVSGRLWFGSIPTVGIQYIYEIETNGTRRSTFTFPISGVAQVKSIHARSKFVYASISDTINPPGIRFIKIDPNSGLVVSTAVVGRNGGAIGSNLDIFDMLILEQN